MNVIYDENNQSDNDINGYRNMYILYKNNVYIMVPVV